MHPIMTHYGGLFAGGFVLASVSSAAWVLTRRASRSGRIGSSMGVIALIGECLAPAAVSLCPNLLARQVRTHIAGDERCERLGADRVLGMTLLVGLSSGVALSPLLADKGILALFVPLCTTALAFMFVAFTIRSLNKERLATIRRDFPSMLDVIALLVRGGMPPSVALEQAAAAQSGDALRRELGKVVHAIRLGCSRASALDEFARRVPLEEAADFVSTVLRSDQLGTPLADAVERFADHLRETRVQQAEAIAGRASVKIMGPAAILLVAILLILFAPFGIKLVHTGLPF